MHTLLSLRLPFVLRAAVREQKPVVRTMLCCAQLLCWPPCVDRGSASHYETRQWKGGVVVCVCCGRFTW